MRNRFLLLFGLLISLSIQAQEGPICGTHGKIEDVLVNRLINNKKAVAEGPIQFRDIQYIPIKFHLVARDDGTGRVLERDLMNQMCALNEDFLEQEIQFFIYEGFNYIDRDQVYSNHQNTLFFLELQRSREALNIFIVEDASPISSGIGTVLGYYDSDPDRDWVVMRIDQVNAGNITLTHEIGHFFSLPHPHRGWDSEPWSQERFGCPTPERVNGRLIEKADGSNCDVAGDLICDTPADYNGFGWPDCDYDGGACDPDGNPIDPMETNFMGYFLRCPRADYVFTSTQKQLMAADLASGLRSNLRGKSPGSTAIIDGTPTLITPVNGAGTTTDNVELQWTPVTNATQYLVEVSRFPNFPSNNISTFITAVNQLTIGGLDPNRLYYWRVKPFNDYYTCEGFPNFTTFRTNVLSSTNTIKQVKEWNVFPNPAYETSLTLNLSTTQSFNGSIRLLTINGKEVLSMNSISFGQGQQNIEIPTANLEGGVYILNVFSQEGLLSERIVLLE